ncbi:MAG: glycosyltransferase family 2 protein [Rhizobiales bacterium]|nr:glycosyltransferase family 2 protein [Hyphomicrobiales bacterium]
MSVWPKAVQWSRNGAIGLDHLSSPADLRFALKCEPAPKAIVAIPARNEATRLSQCLSALLHQRSEQGQYLYRSDVGFVIVCNNCTDRSATLAIEMLQGSGSPFIVLDTQLPPAHANAGNARRMAMNVAAGWMERYSLRDGALLTTDADSRVPPDWVARNLAALRTCPAVAGRFVLDGGEDALSAQMRARIELEQRYEDQLLRLAARLDPRAHDPWPNHRVASGTSYGVTLGAYRTIGGLPVTSCGEDRALERALEERDIPIRHDPAIVVATSARLEGRAHGGCADALRLRSEVHDIAGDAALEPVLLAARRFAWRGRLRRLHASGRQSSTWLAALHLPARAREWMDEAFFGRVWAHVEAASPRLTPRALRPAELSAQIKVADGILACRPCPTGADPTDNRASCLAG